MYLSTQLHYIQNADDNSLCRLNIKARTLPAGVPLSLYSEAIEFLPFRHSISGTPLRDAVLPSGKSSLLLIHPLYSFTSSHSLASSTRKAASSLSPPVSCASPLCSPALLSRQIISFIAIPLLRFLFTRQTMECSFLGACGHADSRNDNKSSAKNGDEPRARARAHFRLLYKFVDETLHMDSLRCRSCANKL